MGVLLRYLLIFLFILWVARILQRLLGRAESHPGESQSQKNGPQDPYEVLGVSRRATRDEIKKAYREALAKHHPDKVEHLGEDIKKVARQKTQEIQEAFARLNR